jgi:hypothetical protein
MFIISNPTEIPCHDSIEVIHLGVLSIFHYLLQAGLWYIILSVAVLRNTIDQQPFFPRVLNYGYYPTTSNLYGILSRHGLFSSTSMLLPTAR